MLSRLLVMLIAVSLIGYTLVGQTSASSQAQAPFGGAKDVAFAKKLWKAMEGYEGWKLTTALYKGASPHGKWVRLYSTWVTVDGRPYPIIVKDNFGGRGVTQERVAGDPGAWRKAVTIMLQREEDYDPETKNWFWVKYGKDGAIEKNEQGTLLAGRVAKGMSRGCISCHASAEGGDYLYSNDD